MRVSQKYKLGATQAELEFVDVDIRNDTKLFVDPMALTYIESDWAEECVSLIQDFFSEVMDSIQSGDSSRARRLLASLSEPNEAHLGLSKGRSAGSGVGDVLAHEIYDALVSSRASSTGLLSDLQDTILFVDSIGHDRVSDITINIIRSQLITFTQDVCRYYLIPMKPGVSSGRLWDRQKSAWTQNTVELPVPTKGGPPLLLIPKSIARRRGIFDPGEYYTHYILPYLQSEELAQDGPLVRRRKYGARYVTKKSIREREERDDRPTKQINIDITESENAILEQYRADKARRVEPLSHDELADATATPHVDFDKLLQNVIDVPTGRPHADKYHRAVQALLTPLFYPALDMPKREFKIHEGRKRIDIRYTNLSTHGFFWWLQEKQQVLAAQIYVECKNYGSSVDNPALDQLAGRFSRLRGQFGLLCHRGFNDKADLVRRCRDTALDGRGYMIALDDTDLQRLVEERVSGGGVRFDYMLERFNELT